MGEGKAVFKGNVTGAQLLKIDLLPYKLKAKEGLSLINGTQFISSLGSLAACDSMILTRAADSIAALSLIALEGSLEPFDPRISAVKPHPGQKSTAENMLDLLLQTDYGANLKASHLQDPYCLRCIPQVHGASRDHIDFATKTLETELNSSTDNPIVIDSKLFCTAEIFTGKQQPYPAIF